MKSVMVFAEVYPEDKYRIVKLLQSSGHMVGMTGDGVNDAPALKQAEMGIAVSNSTDVAKASASIVLTEQGVGVIIDAIKTSRKIYQRMLSWVINKVTKVVQFIVLLTLGFFWLHDAVISLLGMVLLVFANDFITMSLATDNVKNTTNPNKWNVKNITFASLVIGILLVVEGATAIIIGIAYFDLELEKLRTFVMLLLIFTSQFRVYLVRERKHFWSSRPGKELLVSTAAAIIVFTFLGVYGIIIPALTLNQVLFILGFSALFTLLLDPPKYYVFKKFGFNHTSRKLTVRAAAFGYDLAAVSQDFWWMERGIRCRSPRLIPKELEHPKVTMFQPSGTRYTDYSRIPHPQYGGFPRENKMVNQPTHIRQRSHLIYTIIKNHIAISRRFASFLNSKKVNV